MVLPATPNSEMSSADHELLLSLLQRKNPKSVLEIGVSAGGTTKLLLNNLPHEATLYSVDIATQFYKDKTKQTGYLADDSYNKKIHPTWEKHFGMDISSCIENIGSNIDFVVLDTVHALPGEVLQFLVLFPYTQDGAVVFIHDIALHVAYKQNRHNAPLNKYRRNAYCNMLLFHAIYSNNKFVSKEKLPNSGALIVDKKLINKNIIQIFNTLYLDWQYIPNNAILLKTRDLISKTYPKDYLDLYDGAVQYSKEIKESKKTVAAQIAHKIRHYFSRKQ